MIHPKELISKYSVEDFCKSANKPFAEIHDPVPLMAKPFGNAAESVHVLYHLSLLLTELEFAKTLRIVDFGAGTCWLSRCLSQMGAATISVDPSEAALEIGKKLFEQFPVIGGGVATPIFLTFDGHQIELPDSSVDRVITFYSFHHIPNQEQILSEFARILKPGGRAAFCEPGRWHSRSPESQSEMQLHHVLENDVLLEDIWFFAQKYGFTKMTLKNAINPASNKSHSHVKGSWKRLIKKIAHPFMNFLKFQKLFLCSHKQPNIFFLHKGKLVKDTRMSSVARGQASNLSDSNELLHDIDVNLKCIKGFARQAADIQATVKNKGKLVWIHENTDENLHDSHREYGVVKLGAHLCDSTGAVVQHDFARQNMSVDIKPMESETLSLHFALPARPGRYVLRLDMVVEHVCWFGDAGPSKAVELPVEVA
jgi:ubiquinone/menaquinone biosynthesis C-methylase UbiE